MKSKADVKEYYSIVDEFTEKIRKFKVNKELNEEPNQFLYVSSIPIKSIHPLADKRESEDIYKK